MAVGIGLRIGILRSARGSRCCRATPATVGRLRADRVTRCFVSSECRHGAACGRFSVAPLLGTDRTIAVAGDINCLGLVGCGESAGCCATNVVNKLLQLFLTGSMKTLRRCEGSNPGRTTHRERFHFRAVFVLGLLESLPQFLRHKPLRDLTGVDEGRT